MASIDCNDIIQEAIFNKDLPYIKWSTLDRGKYLLLYTTVPCFVLAKIRAKTLIPGVNPCLESDVFIFKTINEAEKFFNELTSNDKKDDNE